VEGLRVRSSDLDILRESFSVMMRGSQFKVNTLQEGKGLAGVWGLNGKVSSDLSGSLLPGKLPNSCL
jgi:hypothetical protein